MSSSVEISRALASIKKKKQKCENLFKIYAELRNMHPFQQELMDHINKDFDNLVTHSVLCLNKAKDVIREIGKTNFQNTVQERRSAISKQVALVRQEKNRFNSANQAHTDHHELYRNYRKSQNFQETLIAAIKKKVPSLMLQCSFELSAFETVKLYQERGDKLTETIKKEVEDINFMVDKAIAFVEKLWEHHKAQMQNPPGASKEPRLSQLSSSLLSWCSTASSGRSSGSSSQPCSSSDPQPSSSSFSQLASSPASPSSTSSFASTPSPTLASTIPYPLSLSPSHAPRVWGTPASESTADLFNSTMEDKPLVKEEAPAEDPDMFSDSLA